MRPFFSPHRAKKLKEFDRPNDGFLEQLDVFYRASYKISRWNKAMRMYYLERALDEIISTSSSLTHFCYFHSWRNRRRRLDPKRQHVRQVPALPVRLRTCHARREWRSAQAHPLQDVPPGARRTGAHARPRASRARHARVRLRLLARCVPARIEYCAGRDPACVYAACVDVEAWVRWCGWGETDRAGDAEWRADPAAFATAPFLWLVCIFEARVARQFVAPAVKRCAKRESTCK